MNKACLLAAVRCHQVTSDENECMRGDALAVAIEEDKSKGLVPFYVSIFLPHSHDTKYNFIYLEWAPSAILWQ